MLKLVLPSGKSLEEQTLKLFEEADFPVHRNPRQQKVTIGDPFIPEVLIAQPWDIPGLVEKGFYDVGICGLDCVREAGVHIEVVAELPYSRTTSGSVKVVLFCSADNPIQEAADIEPESEILSEYPNCTRKYFEELGIPVKV